MFRNLIIATSLGVATLFGSSQALAQAGDTATDKAAEAAKPEAAKAGEGATAPAKPEAGAAATAAPTAATLAAEPAKAEALPTEAAPPEAQSAEVPVEPKAEAVPDDKPEAKAAGAAKEGGDKAAKGKSEKKEEETVEYALTDAEPDSMWLPAKSGSGQDVDWMFYAILGLSIFCFVAITIAVVYLTWRYRHREGHRTEPSPAHDNVLEVTWTVIPSIICVLIFIGGWKGYLNMTTPPGDAIEINVTGQKWVWSFDYQVGQDTLNYHELHIPVDQPVKLTMRSEDVLHSFYVPSARLKQDVLPQRYTYLWFEADTPGVYRVYCAEFCGNDHSAMYNKVVVHESGGFERWLSAEYEKSQVDCRDLPEEERQDCYMAQGEKIYEKRGCKQCHSIDGSSSTGPTFKGMWGESRSFTDGTSGTVDENYVRESVLEPMAKVRSGFSPVMPTFKGKLKDKDIDALNNWMKTL